MLYFKNDKLITWEVVNDTQVQFRGEVMYLSGSADIVLRELGCDWGRTFRGPSWWCVEECVVQRSVWSLSMQGVRLGTVDVNCT